MAKKFNRETPTKWRFQSLLWEAVVAIPECQRKS
jgi:hypothetical protein